MQEDDQALGTPIQHAVVLGAHVAAQLAQLPVYLGAVWEGKMRHRIREIVQPIELAKQSSSALGIEAVDEFSNGLRSIAARK